MSDNLPEIRGQPNRVAPYLFDVDTHLVQMRMHDTDDTILYRSYWLLMVEDASGEKVLSTRLSMPVSTESDID